MNKNILAKTIQDIFTAGKGILAADESSSTIKKRFDSIGIESTVENRQDYRETLFATPNLSKFIGGVILFEETLGQKTKDGVPFPEFLAKNNIIPGIKVDKGLVPLNFDSYDIVNITSGLDGLDERLKGYKTQGARFAKWRAVYRVSNHAKNSVGWTYNAEALAIYAHMCQRNDIVPIIEPEILMDGAHDIEACEITSRNVLTEVFAYLSKYEVYLEGIILKTNMIVGGKEYQHGLYAPEVVADRSLRVYRDIVPAAVPALAFLSGGLSDDAATKYLNAMNVSPLARPWKLSFSYGRALQNEALRAWGKGDKKLAQEMLLNRAKANQLAAIGNLETAEV